MWLLCLGCLPAHGERTGLPEVSALWTTAPRAYATSYSYGAMLYLHKQCSIQILSATSPFPVCKITLQCLLLSVDTSVYLMVKDVEAMLESHVWNFLILAWSCCSEGCLTTFSAVWYSCSVTWIFVGTKCNKTCRLFMQPVGVWVYISTVAIHSAGFFLVTCQHCYGALAMITHDI